MLKSFRSWKFQLQVSFLIDQFDKNQAKVCSWTIMIGVLTVLVFIMIFLINIEDYYLEFCFIVGFSSSLEIEVALDEFLSLFVLATFILIFNKIMRTGHDYIKIIGDLRIQLSSSSIMYKLPLSIRILINYNNLSNLTCIVLLKDFWLIHEINLIQNWC